MRRPPQHTERPMARAIMASTAATGLPLKACNTLEGMKAFTAAAARQPRIRYLLMDMNSSAAWLTRAKALALGLEAITGPWSWPQEQAAPSWICTRPAPWSWPQEHAAWLKTAPGFKIAAPGRRPRL